VLCVSAWLAMAVPASPQEAAPETLKQLSMEELSRIEVTSVTKEAVPAFKTPAAIRVLTAAWIHESGARTIPDLLRLIPGVDVAQVDSNSWAIGVRGFQGGLSRSVLVLIDGRSVYTPLFAGAYWEMQDVMLEDIMLEDIERIEVIGGTTRMRELLADRLAYTEIAGSAESPAELVDFNLVLRQTREALKIAIDETGTHIAAEPMPSL